MKTWVFRRPHIQRLRERSRSVVGPVSVAPPVVLPPPSTGQQASFSSNVVQGGPLAGYSVQSGPVKGNAVQSGPEIGQVV